MFNTGDNKETIKLPTVSKKVKSPECSWWLTYHTKLN